MASGKKSTLKEVAKHLGVSVATVSNAFNRPDQLSSKLREHILTESAKLGYTGPNLAARSLRRGESGVIGVMLADSLSYSFSDPVANQLLQGISDVLAEENKQLLLLSSDIDNKQQSSAESLPDGFIFYGAPQGASFERVIAAGKPAVAIDFEQSKTGSVNINNYDAAKEAALHAFAGQPTEVSVLGMRIIDSLRVCRLVKEDLDADSPEISRQRLKGYLDAAGELAFDIKPEQIWHIPTNTPEQAELAAKEALMVQERPKVLLCMSDVIALAALRVAMNLQIKVPEQLKIVGFDDIPEASRAIPSLTTVCQQSREKGRLAAKMLINNETDQHVVLDTELIKRKSTVAS